MTEPFPLAWPQHWPRTHDYDRRDSQFKTALGKSRDGLLLELERLGAEHVVVSTDIATRIDGLFYAASPEPNDPGVAVYFHWRGKPYTVACDTYERVRENVRAIGKTIEAMRTIERHGATQLLERAVSGFSALPPGGDAPEPEPEIGPWWEVLNMGDGVAGVSFVEVAGNPGNPMRKSVLQLAETIYRDRSKKAHPDRGGSADATRDLNLAIAAARKALA